MHRRKGAASEAMSAGPPVAKSGSRSLSLLLRLPTLTLFSRAARRLISRPLKLLAQLCLLWLVDTLIPSCRSLVAVSLRCDNAGAEAATAKGLSGVRSLALVLTAFLGFQRTHGVLAEVTHVPGFKNQLADELSRWLSGAPPLPLSSRFQPPVRRLLAGGVNRLQLAPPEAIWPLYLMRIGEVHR